MQAIKNEKHLFAIANYAVTETNMGLIKIYSIIEIKKNRDLFM